MLSLTVNAFLSLLWIETQVRLLSLDQFGIKQICGLKVEYQVKCKIEKQREELKTYILGTFRIICFVNLMLYLQGSILETA